MALAHTRCSVMGASLEEGDVVRYADQRPRVARQGDNGAGAEDRVDGTALVAELAQVGAAAYGVGVGETLDGAHALSSLRRQRCGSPRLPSPSRVTWPCSRSVVRWRRTVLSVSSLSSASCFEVASPVPSMSRRRSRSAAALTSSGLSIARKPPFSSSSSTKSSSGVELNRETARSTRASLPSAKLAAGRSSSTTTSTPPVSAFEPRTASPYSPALLRWCDTISTASPEAAAYCSGMSASLTAPAAFSLSPRRLVHLSQVSTTRTPSPCW